jgi:methylmalonyl-CoA mutase cobalamin-binding subunit
MKYHTTKSGKKILLSDLELSHLKNIIKLIEKKAKEGLKIIMGGGSIYEGDIWYDEETYYGEKCKNELGYYFYVKELKSRL